ncbi:MAG: hypothetical protein WDO73_11275 [Ignavibacteriota bacterium]
MNSKQAAASTLAAGARPLRNSTPREIPLDVIAHALWTTAAGVAGRSKLKRPIHLGWLAAWGVFPDLAVFTIPAAIPDRTLAHGRIPKRCCPTVPGRVSIGPGPSTISRTAESSSPPVSRQHGCSPAGRCSKCSAGPSTFSSTFSRMWVSLRSASCGPLSSVHMDGIRWETPWLLEANYAALASVYLVLWLRHRLRGPFHAQCV